MPTPAPNHDPLAGPAGFWPHFLAWVAACGGVLSLTVAGFFLLLSFPLPTLLEADTDILVEWTGAVIGLGLGCAVAFGAGFTWTLFAVVPIVLLIRAALLVTRFQPSLAMLTTGAGTAVAFAATLPLQLVAMTEPGSASVFPVTQIAVACVLVYGQAVGGLSQPAALRRHSGRGRRPTRFRLGQALAVVALISVLLGLFKAASLMTAAMGYAVVFAVVVHLATHHAIVWTVDRCLRLRFARRRRRRRAGRST